MSCHNCGKRGHIAAVCRSKKKTPRPESGPTHKPPAPAHLPRNRYQKKEQPWNTKYVAAQGEQEEETETDVSDTEEMRLHAVGSPTSPPIEVTLLINGKTHQFELDTGAAVTIMSQSEFQRLLPRVVLRKCAVLLKTYSGERLTVVGDVDVQVQYEQQVHALKLTVVTGSGPSLLGRDWLQYLRPNWKEIRNVVPQAGGRLAGLLETYGEFFKEEVGTIRSHQAKLELKPEAQPKFCKFRTVPYHVRTPIEDKLDRLEREGVLEKVTFSEWATPIVAVPKSDGKVRLCGDFKVTVNPQLKVDQYPLPKAEDLFAMLAGGKRFTKLDLSQAYLQLELHPDSCKYCTINTHRGLYQFTWLPFGIASAPAVFQKIMDTILQGIPRAMCYINDILVTGSSEDEHLRTLDEVLHRLQKHGIRMKKKKCFFMEESVEYLGHRVDAEGLRATPEKVAAIAGAPEPKNIQQLRSFLGLLNYYRKFLPNLASTIQPLNNLLQKNRAWKWTPEAMKAAKRLLLVSNLLTHYDPALTLKMAADASPDGLGAVISHVLPDGVE